MLLNTPLSQLVESEPASDVCDINLEMSLPENTHSKIAGTLIQLMTRWQASAEGSGEVEVAKKMSGRRYDVDLGGIWRS